MSIAHQKQRVKNPYVTVRPITRDPEKHSCTSFRDQYIDPFWQVSRLMYQHAVICLPGILPVVTIVISLRTYDRATTALRIYGDEFAQASHLFPF